MLIDHIVRARCQRYGRCSAATTDADMVSYLEPYEQAYDLGAALQSRGIAAGAYVEVLSTRPQTVGPRDSLWRISCSRAVKQELREQVTRV